MKVVVDKDGFEKELWVILEKSFDDVEFIHSQIYDLRKRIMIAFNFYSEDINE